jgi:transcription elongation factor Elf1
MTNPKTRKPALPTTLRCPYCVESSDSKVMISKNDGEWLMCARCGHLTLLTNPLFVCTCAKCVGLRIA